MLLLTTKTFLKCCLHFSCVLRCSTEVCPVNRERVNLHTNDVIVAEFVLYVILEIHIQLGEEDLKPIRRECGMDG